MIQRILTMVIFLSAVAYGLGFVLPDKAHVEREITIAAPPEQVFALVGELQEWPRWSPWAEKDPNAAYTLNGEGASQTLEWNSEVAEVGSGVQTVTAYEPPQRVAFDLVFEGMGEAKAEMLLSETESGTMVRWVFDTEMRKGAPMLQQPIATYVGFFMDGMLGPEYERGLENLKRIAEGE
ncbi:MAG: SRPBCC family protein [Rhodobacteraceae bacterium]|nr:SRPBCC family protein [Paracoccaceae bacterium]